MKRLLCVLLMVVLLAGCGGSPVPESSAEMEPSALEISFEVPEEPREPDASSEPGEPERSADQDPGVATIEETDQKAIDAQVTLDDLWTSKNKWYLCDVYALKAGLLAADIQLDVGVGLSGEDAKKSLMRIKVGLHQRNAQST